MSKLFNQLFKDLCLARSGNGDQFTHFCFASLSHLLIILFLKSKDKGTLEEINSNISRKIVSRSTIQNILKDGQIIGFFEKEINISDKRSKFYKLSPKANETINYFGKKYFQDQNLSGKLKKIA